MSAVPESYPDEGGSVVGPEVRPATLEERRHLRWVFVGQGPMGAAALVHLLVAHRPVAVVTSEVPWGPQPVADVAGARRLPLVRTPRLGDDPWTRWPEAFSRLDLGVCACWGELLRPGALGLPARGWLNLHPSSLPAWRGADPVGWQLLTAPTSIGCSVHRMTDGADDGPVVAVGQALVHAEDDRGALLARAGAELGRLATGLISRLARGRALEEQPQDGAAATWCPPPGVSVAIDPRALRALSAARAARAFSPSPGVVVTALHPEERFAVTGLGAALSGGEAPGDVVREQGGRVAVACRDRWLRGSVGASGVPGPSVTALDDPPLPRR